MILPLKARLTLWYAVLLAVIISIWSLSIVALVRADLYAGIDRDLASRASQIGLSITSPDEGEFRDISDSTLKNVPKQQTVAQLLTSTGAVIEDSGAKFAAAPIVSQAVVRAASRSSDPVYRTVTRGEDVYRLLIVALPGTSRVLLVGTNSDVTDDAIVRLITVMLLTGPAVLLAAGAGGWFLARRALRPVTDMTTTAAGIGIDRLDERVPVPPGADELAALANTLNTMLERLEMGVKDKRRLVADASHELQTPLAVMRTELDVTLASSALPPEAVEVLESVREEADRLIRIVRNLLTLARFDEGTLRLLRKPVSLLAVARESAASLDALARERGVAVAVTGDDVIVDGDTEYLRLVADNLLENAIKYSGSGTSVEITTFAKDGEALLSVRDTGPGIPLEARSHLFDRFFRVDRSRSKSNGGSGLGLAITREIVEAHGGRVGLRSEVGEGSTFTVSLRETPHLSTGDRA